VADCYRTAEVRGSIPLGSTKFPSNVSGLKLHVGGQEVTSASGQHRVSSLSLAMGPITLFDKSFIEMLNVDEAVLFDALFSTNICPIYYVEVLADLDLENPGARTREKVVGDLAAKTPVMHSAPNVVHTSICLGELNGHHTEMR